MVSDGFRETYSFDSFEESIFVIFTGAEICDGIIEPLKEREVKFLEKINYMRVKV
jgi:hypothetical protein